MKYLVGLFLGFGIAGFVSAQTVGSVTNWVQVDLPNDEFYLEAPEGFQFSKPREAGNKIEARAEYHSGAVRFFMFIDSKKKPAQRRQVESFLRSEKQSTPAVLPDAEGAKLEFEDSSGYYHRLLLVQTTSRIFTVQTVSRKKDSEAAIRFMNSFKLMPVAGSGGAATHPGVIFTSESAGISSPETVPTPMTPTQLRDSESRYGSAKEYGSGAPSSSGTAVPTAQRVIKELKILYKHKASYTDFARFYNIQGTVLLRVTFLTSGEIGSVTKIQSLPFGLTESAIFAARQMKFEPETVNGVPRNTSRPVSFSFSIY